MNLTKHGFFFAAILLFWSITAIADESFAIQAFQEKDTLRLSFKSAEGVHYRVQSSNQFRSNTVWTTVSNILGSGDSNELVFPIANTERYFRILTRTNPLYGKKLLVSPNSQVLSLIQSWRSTRPDDALTISKATNIAIAHWFGDWNSNVRADVARHVAKGRIARAVPLTVAYNIPIRDCNNFSSGGADSPEEYLDWITEFAAGIGTNEVVVILEPDALANLDCGALTLSNKNERVMLISQAVDILKRNPQTYVYIDAGHSEWIKDIATIVKRLESAGVANADGFCLNVSNFRSNKELIAYGTSISRRIGDAHFIIDTSRNGLGPRGTEWCNPPGRALGTPSTANTGHPQVDAFAYVKDPSQSDGECNDSPTAGSLNPEYFLGLAQRALF